MENQWKHAGGRRSFVRQASVRDNKSRSVDSVPRVEKRCVGRNRKRSSSRICSVAKRKFVFCLFDQISSTPNELDLDAIERDLILSDENETRTKKSFEGQTTQLELNFRLNKVSKRKISSRNENEKIFSFRSICGSTRRRNRPRKTAPIRIFCIFISIRSSPKRKSKLSTWNSKLRSPISRSFIYSSPEKMRNRCVYSRLNPKETRKLWRPSLFFTHLQKILRSTTSFTTRPRTERVSIFPNWF